MTADTLNGDDSQVTEYLATDAERDELSREGLLWDRLRERDREPEPESRS